MCHLFLGALLGLALSGATSTPLKLQDLPDAAQKTITANVGDNAISDIEHSADNGGSYNVKSASKSGVEKDLSVAQDGTLLSVDVTLDALPDPVQAAIKTQVGTGHLEGVEKLFDAGETNYRAGITAPGDTERDYTYAGDGSLMEEEVNLAELPDAVQTAINTQVGTGTLEGIDKSIEDGETTYEATAISDAGQERNFTIGEDGKVLDQEVGLSDLPDAVQATINAHLGQDQLATIDVSTDDGDTSYDVTTSAGEKNCFTVSQDGTLLSQQTSLEVLPAPVQATINQNIGDGTISRIDRAYVYGNGKRFMHYEIEGRKDGKAFNFLVGPKAKFLGMDDDSAPAPMSAQ